MKPIIPLLFLVLNCSSGLLLSQSVQLYEPINYQTAVKNGTRSRDGKPGPRYWQNHADYDIQVKLDTATHEIFGTETITYYNESPDTLTRIVLRLIQNIYKKGAVRNNAVNPGNLHDGVNIDTLIINGTGITLNDSTIMYNGTNMRVKLKNQLPPHAQLTMYCKWNYKLAVKYDFKRNGYFKDKAWFIGHFYPQIAVYDDLEFFYGHKGWDFILYHQGWQEFYNDFNNYKVSIQVPDGFYIWATGTLLNAREIYPEAVLDSINKAKTTNEIVHILDSTNFGNNPPLGNIWKYEAQEVPDFAFGAAMDYYWDASSVAVGDKRVFVDVAYHPESVSFPYLIDVARSTIQYASENFLALPYPWEHATTFNGEYDGGMEYPMIANNCDTPDTAFARTMTFHEIFHNYTPFMMGFNEKRYPFMDEGITETSTYLYYKDTYQKDFYAINDSTFSIMHAYSNAALDDDAPMYIAYALLSDNNFYYQYYVKPVVAYLLFIDMIGRDEFKRAFHEFANRWRGKHPTPYDMFYTFNDVLGENYNWFWKPWFFDFGYPDLALEMENNLLIVKRVGTGSLPVPVKLKVKYKNGKTITIEKSMNVWKDGRKEIAISLKDWENISVIETDNQSVPDIDKSNNILLLNK